MLVFLGRLFSSSMRSVISAARRAIARVVSIASSLPDLRRIENGDSVKALQRRSAELLVVQQNMLTKLKASNFNAAPVTEKDKPDPNRTGDDAIDTTRVGA